jgi:hypothetical protein
MPDLVKIGYTDRDPSIRVAEQHSGLPYHHDLEYEILVEDAFNLEQIIHKRLSDYNESINHLLLNLPLNKTIT